jgi:hypothetical protein
MWGRTFDNANADFKVRISPLGAVLLNPEFSVRHSMWTRWRAPLALCLLAYAFSVEADSQSNTNRGREIVVFSEPGFPAVDSANASEAKIEGLFPEAQFASAEELPGLLAATSTRLLVLPYGSAFSGARLAGHFPVSATRGKPICPGWKALYSRRVSRRFGVAPA